MKKISSANHLSSDAPAESTRAALGKLAALALLGASAAFFPKLSMPACFLSFVGVIVTPRFTGRMAHAKLALLGVAVLGSSIGFMRFVLEEAIPGVVAGGKVAVERQAISFLRAVVTAQDKARSNADLDPDGDGIGTSLTLRELAGLAPIGSKPPSNPPPLALKPDDFVATAAGDAVSRAGYLFVLCLPARGGGLVTEFEAPAERDFELGERRYTAYAWPRTLGAGSPTTAYFTDEHERILTLATDGKATPRYVGATRPPSCSAASTNDGWTAWKDKQPRQALPGDGTVPDEALNPEEPSDKGLPP